jgi:hypothetical protein
MGGAGGAGGQGGSGGDMPCVDAGDCRLFESYCELSPCACIPLGVSEPDPMCQGAKVECLFAPCNGLHADCVAGECVAVP